MDNSLMVTNYLAEHAATNWGSGTVRLRAWQLHNWLRFIYPASLDEVTRTDFVRWLAGFTDVSSRRSALSAVGGLYRWCRETGQVSADPTLGVPAPLQPRGVPRPIPDNLFWATYAGANPQVREILILARFAGLRCDEVARSHRAWLIGDRLIVPGKGAHIDPIPAHPRVKAVFVAHTGWLFPSTSPKSRRRFDHLTPAHVSLLGNRALAKTAPGWTMHKLRHAYGTEVYETCHDLGVTQTAMRHQSPVTTRGYARLSDERVALAVLGLAAGRLTDVA